MKPTTPIDREMVFLRDVERRVGYLRGALESGRNGIPEALGLQSVVQCRISEVTKEREEVFECDGTNCSPRAHGHKVLI